ncbi:MAG TPA: T9SS type A sorting domain-containing protein, partial [Chitinophagales bacterium]|nr:T9SS type A sorting domain-containing protein [Chitinophagales bacterium]
YFSLERSVNGVDFEILNEQEGAGNSTTLLNYAYVDAHPVAGTNYYRLKQVDFDGTFAYGPVRQVTLTGNVVNNDFNASGIAVYPNPSTGLFSMHATSHVGHGVVRMKVLDAKGQTMVERAVDTGERTQLDMRDFPSGIYMAAFTDANGKTVVKQLVVERR